MKRRNIRGTTLIGFK